MTGTLLTTLGTLGWLGGSVILFILLAHWIEGGSWGISTAIARGITGWTGHGSGSSPGARTGDDLPPIQPPRLDRLWGADPARAQTAGPAPSQVSEAPEAEVVDLGSRRLP